MASSFDEEVESNGRETLASIAEDLVYRLPGCTDLMVRKTIQEVFREFCRKTCALESVRVIELEKNEPCYVISPKFNGCVIDCVVSVSIDSRTLHEDEYRVVDRIIHLESHIIPRDDEERKLYVACVEIPKSGSEEIPELFAERYGDAIKSGVLARLFSMTGRAWSDASAAVLEMRNYESALTETRVRHHGGGQYSPGKINFIGRGNII